MTQEQFKSIANYYGQKATYTQTYLNENDRTEKREGIIYGSTKEGRICLKDIATGTKVFTGYECVEL